MQSAPAHWLPGPSLSARRSAWGQAKEAEGQGTKVWPGGLRGFPCTQFRVLIMRQQMSTPEAEKHIFPKTQVGRACWSLKNNWEIFHRHYGPYLTRLGLSLTGERVGELRKTCHLRQFLGPLNSTGRVGMLRETLRAGSEYKQGPWPFGREQESRGKHETKANRACWSGGWDGRTDKMPPGAYISSPAKEKVLIPPSNKVKPTVNWS